MNLNSMSRRIVRMLPTATIMLALVGLSPLWGQQNEAAGELRGRVSGQEDGEPIIRANVVIAGTKLGATTDLKGTYTVRKVPPGTYTIKVSYVGYVSQEISGVEIDEKTRQLDIVLIPQAVKAREIVVSGGRAGQGTETAILNERRKSATISDGISAAQIRRLPDATSAESLSRVTGMSIVGNRFAYVRGTSERYSNTQLNGVSLVSTEPDKKAFSYDLFPSNLLENTVVSKTFTPDLPGDFSGGLVQLNTIDFPDQSTFRITLSGSSLDGTTSRDIEFGPQGAKDYLGFDDGARALPAGLPDTARINSANYSRKQIAEFARLFPGDWGRSTIKAPLNDNFSISYGGRTDLFGNDFGLVAALTYRNGYNAATLFRSDTNRFTYNGFQNSHDILWGGLLNLSYKLSDLHSISIRNVYSRAATNDYTYLDGLNQYIGALQRNYAFHYTERGMYSGQIAGDHVIPQLNDLRIQWRGFGSLGSRNEPDYRRLSYIRYDPYDTSQPYLAAMTPSTPNGLSSGRFYSNLTESVAGFGADFSVPVDILKLKVGGLVENKGRNFKARVFGYLLGNKRQDLLTASIDTLFDPSHVADTALTIEETTAPSDNYDAASHLRAGYAMLDLPFGILGQNFRFIAGARLENFERIVNTADIHPINIDSTDVDLLPSLNLTYMPWNSVNVRLAYSRTVARPEFREFAKFVFYDFTTNQLVYGNPSLQRARINNFDLRVEFFPNAGEIFAVSLFHKDFQNAIEEVTINSPGNGERTWANAPTARNTGIELEARKSFDFISDWFSRFAFSMNYTWLNSRVDVMATELYQGKEGRRLQGQAPYMINAGFYFNDEDLGTTATLTYNRIGERITEVAPKDIPDFVERPRDLLDVSVSQSFLTNLEAKLTVRNVLSKDQEFYQGDRLARSNSTQTGLSLSISARF